MTTGLEQAIERMRSAAVLLRQLNQERDRIQAAESVILGRINAAHNDFVEARNELLEAIVGQ